MTVITKKLSQNRVYFKRFNSQLHTVFLKNIFKNKLSIYQNNNKKYIFFMKLDISFNKLIDKY